jgi:4-hydroxy-tetrahydrodipicolinate synthase
MHAMIDFHGVFTALITPFDEDGATVDVDRLVANVGRQAAGGVRGVVPCGTTGETPTLTSDECRLVVTRTIETARPLGLTVIAGAGANATRHALEQHRFVAEAGADAALHVTPYYNKPSQEGLYRHFMTLADGCDLPIVLYNIPGRTGVALDLATIERLATHPNVIAIKEASGGFALVAEVVARTDLAVLSGDDPLTLPLCTVGAVGVISVLSNLAPARVAALCDAIEHGAWDEAQRINAALLPLARDLLALDSNPVPLKTALRLLDLDTGAVRLPLCPPAETVATRLSTLLAASGLDTEAALVGAAPATPPA